LVVGDAKGQVHSLDAKNLKLLSTVAHKSKGAGKNPWVEAVKFSPDGRMVAWGIHGAGSNVEIATADSKSFKLKHEASIDIEMGSALAQLDWSVDSALMTVVSKDGNLLFVDITKRARVEPAAVRDVQWATRSCKFGHGAQGIWPGHSEVNAVARSHSGKVLATAEDDGLVKLFRYPCTVEKAASKESRGHGSHVTRVVFSARDEHVITVGGYD
jgi:microtubule-associated protein-like 6